MTQLPSSPVVGVFLRQHLSVAGIRLPRTLLKVCSRCVICGSPQGCACRGARWCARL